MESSRAGLAGRSGESGEEGQNLWRHPFPSSSWLAPSPESSPRSLQGQHEAESQGRLGQGSPQVAPSCTLGSPLLSLTRRTPRAGSRDFTPKSPHPSPLAFACCTQG